MKKHKVPALLFGLLVFASIGAFIYLNSLTPVPEGHNIDQHMRSTRMEEIDSPVLPDVKLIQKAVQAGKRFIPAF